MRIITGSARGRRIGSVPGETTRPSADRVKESLFGIIQRDVPEAIVLDLFSGSGSLAFEALSRGAAFAVANDQNRACVDMIAANAKTLGMEARIEITQMDFQRCLERQAGRRFDLVFIDPPYASGMAMQALTRIAALRLLAVDGLCVVERGEQTPWNPDELAGLVHTDSRRYGHTTLEFFRPDAGRQEGSEHA